MQPYFRVLAIASVLIFFPQFLFNQTKKETSQWNSCLKKAESKSELENKLDIFKSFLLKYPNHYYASEAEEQIAKIQLRLIEPKDFEAAEAENTFDSFRNFIIKHKEGALVERAKIKAIGLFFSDKSLIDLAQLFIHSGIAGEYEYFPRGESFSPTRGGTTYSPKDYDVLFFYEKKPPESPEYIILLAKGEKSSVEALYDMAEDPPSIVRYKYGTYRNGLPISGPYEIGIKYLFPLNTTIEFTGGYCVKDMPDGTWADITYINRADNRDDYDHSRNNFFLKFGSFRIVAVSAHSSIFCDKIGKKLLEAFNSIFQENI